MSRRVPTWRALCQSLILGLGAGSGSASDLRTSQSGDGTARASVTPIPGFGKALVRRVFAWLFFATVAVWVTWPLAYHLSDSLPLGSERTPTVPLLNLWTIWWNVDRIEHGFQDYWSAPIFYPTRDVLAFSEPHVFTGLVAWPLWKLLSTPEAVYNTLLLANLTLNGVLTMSWLRGMRLVGPACILGGLFVELLPFVHWQLGVFQVLPVWGIIITFTAIERAIRRPEAVNACYLGMAFAIAYFLCSYYGVMLSALLCCCIWPLLGRRIQDWKRCGTLLLAGAIALVITLPVTSVQKRVAREHGASVPRATMETLSVQPFGYLRTPWRQYLPVPFTGRPTAETPWGLSPGTLKLLLAAWGAYCGVRQRGRRRLTSFLILVLVISVLLSLGSGFPFVYDIFQTCYPGFRHLRNIYRFAVFAQLMTAALAALGLHFLYRHCVKGDISRPRKVARFAFVAIAAFSVAEAAPPSPRLFDTNALRNTHHWVAWLREHAEPQSVVAFLPFPETAAIWDYVPTARWMYLQMYHHRRMLNGYSGVFPVSYLELQASLSALPYREQVQRLADAGADYLVLAEAPPDSSNVAETVFADPDSGTVILRLR